MDTREIITDKDKKLLMMVAMIGEFKLVYPGARVRPVGGYLRNDTQGCCSTIWNRLSHFRSDKHLSRVFKIDRKEIRRMRWMIYKMFSTRTQTVTLFLKMTKVCTECKGYGVVCSEE